MFILKIIIYMKMCCFIFRFRCFLFGFPIEMGVSCSSRQSACIGCVRRSLFVWCPYLFSGWNSSRNPDVRVRLVCTSGCLAISAFVRVFLILLFVFLAQGDSVPLEIGLRWRSNSFPFVPVPLPSFSSPLRFGFSVQTNKNVAFSERLCVRIRQT